MMTGGTPISGNPHITQYWACIPSVSLLQSQVRKLLRLVAHEWPLLIQAGIFLVVAAIADVLIPHYISQTISQLLGIWEYRGRNMGIVWARI